MLNWYELHIWTRVLIELIELVLNIFVSILLEKKINLTNDFIRAKNAAFLTEHKFYCFIFHGSLEGSMATVDFGFYSEFQLWIRVTFDIIAFSRKWFFAGIWKFNFQLFIITAVVYYYINIYKVINDTMPKTKQLSPTYFPGIDRTLCIVISHSLFLEKCLNFHYNSISKIPQITILLYQLNIPSLINDFWKSFTPF